MKRDWRNCSKSVVLNKLETVLWQSDINYVQEYWNHFEIHKKYIFVSLSWGRLAQWEKPPFLQIMFEGLRLNSGGREIFVPILFNFSCMCDINSLIESLFQTPSIGDKL